MEILGAGIQGVEGVLTKVLTNLTFNPPFIVGIPLSKFNPVLRINWTLSQIMVTCQPGHLARMTLPNWAYKFRKSFVLLTLTP
jgi:cbb3-type cytochrome oxidase subunit 1